MQIQVDSFGGPLASAREALAARIANESFTWLSDVIMGVVMRVPAGRGGGIGDKGTYPCSVVVVLRDGRRFDGMAVSDNVTDAIERACHDVRKEIAYEVGRPLRRRRGLQNLRETNTRLADRRNGTGD